MAHRDAVVAHAEQRGIAEIPLLPRVRLLPARRHAAGVLLHLNAAAWGQLDSILGWLDSMLGCQHAVQALLHLQAGQGEVTGTTSYTLP